MNSIRILLIFTCLLAVSAAMANPVTENQAREIAAQFMAKRSPAFKLSSRAQFRAKAPATNRDAYYVFNSTVADKGFVIVGGDDRLPAVLGYSDDGSFDADDLPPAMQEWLDGYAAQIEAIAAGAPPEVRTTTRAAITPLVPVRWGQDLPYNVLLPHINGSSSAHAYVGCGAVAMAQVMAYWRYPQCPAMTIPGYTSNSGKTYEVTMPSLDPIDFEWSKMHDSYYTNDSTSDACLAVANVMLYCAASLKSDFGLSSTAATTTNLPNGMITHFGYKNSARYIHRMFYSTQSWEETIYAELAAGRPVVYSGSKLSSAHAFVCDGYDGEGRFHINWGWSGKNNGYFFLNLLNPTEEGVGSSTGAYGYVQLQGAAIGLVPGDAGSEGVPMITFESLVIGTRHQSRSSASSNFDVRVSGWFVNNTNVSAQFRTGWGLYNQEGELIKVLLTNNTTNNMGNGEKIYQSNSKLEFGAGITSGTYRIKPFYSIYPSTDYQPCIGSDVYFLEVVFNGESSCTITAGGVYEYLNKYVVNDCVITGTYNHGKPLTVTLNVTNTGYSTNSMIYMFVDGEFTAIGASNIGPGETGDIVYRYVPTTAGTKTLSFSLKSTGDPVLYSQDVTVNTMPAANLDVSYRILNITDEENRVITADSYSIIADITNNGTEAYDEDFSARLYRVTNDNTNSGSELLNQTKPLYLPAGESASLQFDFDHDLIDGLKYFCTLYYYSNGQPKGKSTKWYYLNMMNNPFVPIPRYDVIVSYDPAYGGEAQSSGFFILGEIKGGEIVTVTASPNIGWQCCGATAVDSNGNPVEVTRVENETFTFVMPESAVNVTVHFERSTGSLFEIVKRNGGITPGATYVLASRYHDKTMRRWSDDNPTFQSNDIVEWLGESQAVVRVSDDACFFTMTQMTDTIVNYSLCKEAYLTTGNGYYMQTSDNDVLMCEDIAAECCAWIHCYADNCFIRFNDFTSGSNDDWVVSYDNEKDVFRVMNTAMIGAETSRLSLYKLVDAYGISIDFDPEKGNAAVDGGMVNETAQRGETVTFTVTPAVAYTTGNVQITTVGGEVITADLDKATGTYSFIMPDESVTITATFDEFTSTLGDVDCDGIIGINDVTTLIDYLLGIDVDIDLWAADVTQDGQIGIADVTTIIDMVLE